MKKLALLLTVLMASSILCITDLYGKTESREEFVHEPVFGSKIYLYESGRRHARSVVLVHGTGEDGARIWRNLIPELEKKFHVIAFDLPGFARSGKENQLYSPANFAAFVNWVVKKYTKGPVCVIGHSLGGAISLYYAGTYPENLERLIIVDSAGILYRSAFTKSFISVKPNKVLDIFNVPVATAYNFIIANLEDMDRDLMPGTVDKSLDSEFLRKKIYGGDPAKIAAIALLHTDFSRIIDKVNVPTLIVWGENDPVAPLRTGRLLEWMIPESDLRIMPDTGHCPMLDRSGDFNKIIMNWFSVPVKKKERKEPSFTSEKLFICEDRDCAISGGDYDRIEIKNSNNARIFNVTARHVLIERSIVSIESSYIKSRDVGVEVIDGAANLSGCSIDADIDILASNSSVDLAGVNLTGKTAAIKEALRDHRDKSTVILSVCKIKSPFNDSYKHEIKIVTEKNPY